MKKFEVIYEQKVVERSRYIIECESESVLDTALEHAENDMIEGGFDTFDDFYFSLKKQKEINVVKVNENYEEDWEVPEYYDHYPYKDGD